LRPLNALQNLRDLWNNMPFFDEPSPECQMFLSGCSGLSQSVSESWISVLSARICVWLVLQAAESDFYAIIAVVCTSFCAVNVGTHKRSIAYPDGDPRYSYISDGNCMCARTFGLYSNCFTVIPIWFGFLRSIYGHRAPLNK
jgi:hypothetical protein